MKYKDILIQAKSNRKLIDEFVRKIKNQKRKNIDEQVHELNEYFSSKIDCLQCANCCKTLGPRITEVDIQRISKKLKLKPSEFYNTYLKTDEDGDYVFKAMPCPFIMQDNYCMIYENRPNACREFPHMDRKNIVQIIDISSKNCDICPIVFQIFNKLINK